MKTPTTGRQCSGLPPTKGEEMQNIILKIAYWLISYVPGYHVAKNGGGKRKNTEGSKGNE